MARFGSSGRADVRAPRPPTAASVAASSVSWRPSELRERARGLAPTAGRVADRLVARRWRTTATVRGLAAVTTDLVEEARRRHGTLPTATAALGPRAHRRRCSWPGLKRDERLSLEFSGDGPLRGVLVDATPAGAVRGFVLRPATTCRPARGKLDVGGALGRACSA